MNNISMRDDKIKILPRQFTYQIRPSLHDEINDVPSRHLLSHYRRGHIHQVWGKLCNLQVPCSRIKQKIPKKPQNGGSMGVPKPGPQKTVETAFALTVGCFSKKVNFRCLRCVCWVCKCVENG